MNVWIEAPFDNLPAEGYRPQRYWLMAEAFAACAHPTVLWTSDFSHAAKRPRRLDGSERAAAFRLELVPTRPYRRNLSLGRILSHRAYAAEWERRAIAAVALGELKPPELIVAANPPVGAAAAAVRLARRFGARVAIDIQDAWPENFDRLLPRGLRWAGRLLFAPLYREIAGAYRAAELVTGVSDRYAALAARAGARRFVRAYHGISLDGAPPLARPWAHGPIRVVYAGSFGHGYDLAPAIRGLAELPEGSHLTLAGSGPLGKRWQRLAARVAPGRVTFAGYLARAELERLLGESDVGVIPLADESFVGLPYKLGDYVRSGLRVVTSLGGECAEKLARYGAGVAYLRGDAHSFARAVRAAAALPPDASRALAEAELDARKIYREYVGLFAPLGSASRKNMV